MEFKSMPLSIKDLDSKAGIVTGHASTFNVIDDGKDEVMPGAFKRTINAWGPKAKNRIKNLFMHDPARMVGKPLVLKEDDIGLYHETQISVRNRLAKDVLVLIEDGVITEQSIGYKAIKTKDRDDGVRELREVKLFEYSWVAWGMNEYTPIREVKSEQQYKSLAASMKRFEKALRHGKFETDEIPEMIELALARWQKQIEYWEAKAEPKRAVIDVRKKTPFEVKLADFDEVNNDTQLRMRGWQIMDAMLTVFDEIRWEHGKKDNVAELLAASIDQFKAAMVEWAREAQAAGVFYADPAIIADELDELKAVLSDGLFVYIKALLEKANPAKATSFDEDSHKDDSDSGDHSLNVKEVVEPLRKLQAELQSKYLLAGLREFGKSLRSD